MGPSLFSQPTPLPYWDPANLLQVTSDGDDDNVKINCVGSTFRDVRCRWDIPGPELSKIRSLLREMSIMKPEVVTEETLRRLARLCLCQDWHSGQLHQTVRRWASVVETATLRNKNLIASFGSSSNDWEKRLANSEQTPNRLLAQVASITKQHEGCQDALLFKEKIISCMETSNKMLDARVREESTARVKAEHQTVTLGDQIDKAERQLTDYQTKISVFEEEKRCDKTNDYLRACQTIRDQLEEENKMLRANVGKLALAQDSLAACQAKKYQLERANETRTADFDKLEKDRESLAADLDKLRVESSAFRDGERQVAAELITTNLSLKQCLADLARERDRTTTLNERIASLEPSHAELMESISACWLHKFWAWVSRQRGTSEEPAKMMSQEMVLQTSKV